jgi:hypothetical protein
MGAKRDPVPKNTFLEQLFKPSVVWQDGDAGALINEPAHNASSEKEPDDHIIGDSALEETPSAHEIMALISPWTAPLLAYLTRQ